MDELKPCPWCGETEDLASIYGDRGIWVECLCTGAGPVGETYDDSVELWNRRADQA